MPTYNGHKNWNYWNVSLWINNDEAMYKTARALYRLHKNRRRAALAMVEYLQACGRRATPDGAPYSVSAVAHAMEDM